MHKDRHQELSNLRQQLHHIEQSGGLNATSKSTQTLKTHPALTPANDDKVKAQPFSLPPITTKQSNILAGQLPQLAPQFNSDILTRTVLHEVLPKTYGDPASISFLLLALKMQSEMTPSTAPILWCTTQYQTRDMGELFAPGLLAFDLDPNRFILVRARSDKELLWTLEEAIRAKSFTAVVGYVEDINFTQTRRLSLATQTGATPLFLHRPHHCQGASAAFSRWQIESQMSARNPFDQRAPGTRQLRAHLLRCRTGATGSWNLEYETSTHPVLMVPAAANRTFTPQVAARTSEHRQDGQGFAS